MDPESQATRTQESVQESEPHTPALPTVASPTAALLERWRAANALRGRETPDIDTPGYMAALLQRLQSSNPRFEEENPYIAAMIKRHIKAPEPSNRCYICYEDISDPATLHPCGHIFCFVCIDQWLNSSQASRQGGSKCPMDRTRVQGITHGVEHIVWREPSDSPGGDEGDNQFNWGIL